MKNYHLLPLLIPAALTSCKTDKKEISEKEQTPNIIIFYVDDLGYGDVGCYGAKGVETPNVDSLAANGIKFTDAHCSAATSTPSRYSLLTGSYAFRNKAKILSGEAPLLIRPGMETVPSLLKKAGYSTAVVGKWHLGLGNGNIDWNDSIKPGPHEVGFDYNFLIPATGDRVPCVYVEDYHVVGLEEEDPLYVSYQEKIGERPTGLEKPEMLRQPADTQHSRTIINGISRIGWMKGGENAVWKDEEFPDILTQKARNFIDKNKDNPFFLFFSFHDIHVPRLPNPRFEGKSSMGPRGDAIVQMDWCVGNIVDYLEKLGLAENTLVIFTSDNGPVLNDGYEDEAIEKLGDHDPNGPFRGGKYSAFEAGTRVPMITYWPGVISDSESDALISQVDFMASFAELTGQYLDSTAAPDSYKMLDVLLGKSDKGRKYMMEESNSLQLRMNNWKYIKPSDKKWLYDERKGIEVGYDTVPQLYNLTQDTAEQVNVAEKYPDTLQKMQSVMQEYIDKGYSREGYKIK